jgi:peroxiredoxin
MRAFFGILFMNLRLTLLVAFLALLVFSSPRAEAAEAHSSLGKRIETFSLHDHLGAKRDLAEWKNSRAVVVVFLGCECPLAKLYGPRLAELATEFGPQGVQVIGINANIQDSLQEIAQYVRVHKIDFPVLKDPTGEVADLFGAERTPEAFLLDRDRVVRYAGRIDDQYGVGYSRPEVKRRDLAEAIGELLAGKEISVASTKPVGCHIGRVALSEPMGDITYSKHIAPLFQEHCEKCHREGQVAPFALTDYSEIVGWTETIREVIDEGRMPPWHASPDHGEFFNDARLPDEAKSLISQWIDNGAPEGDPADLPPKREYAEGWRIPTPDVVYSLPEAFEVPAKGTVPYKYFVLDPGFTEDQWIKAAEALPGNPAVVHHLILFYIPPDKKDPGPGDALFNSIAAFAPGMPPQVFRDSHCRRIPAGSKLVFQVHYTPNGSVQKDISKAGLVFADKAEIQKEVLVNAVFNFAFRIPPGAADFPLEAAHRFEDDMELYSLTPHMHLRGKAFRFEAVYPDGNRETLLDVPHYDFNWQNTYLLAEPKPMPAGTELRCYARYDNSADNPVNPDPTKPVMWGDQTWEEMLVGSFGSSLADQDLRLGLPQAKTLESGEYEVTFVYRPAKKVDSVALAGGFNEWSTSSLPMDGPDADGKYTRTVVLPAGAHEYKFVVNGDQWRRDPNNSRKAGDYANSLIEVGQ